jgi:hypothetical protein
MYLASPPAPLAGGATVGLDVQQVAAIGGQLRENFWHRPMNTLKLICLAIIQLVKQACLFPQSIANAVKQRQRQVVLNEHEAERLDRIRNPSKYLGK